MREAGEPGALRVRRARPADAAAIAALDASAFQPSWSEEVWRAEIGRADATILLLASPSGGPVAYLGLRRFRDQAELLRLAVDPSHRRLGLARRLVRTALDRLAGAGIARCWLEVREDNAVARALYRSLGFRQNGRRLAYYADGTAAVLLEAAVDRRALDAGL